MNIFCIHYRQNYILGVIVCNILIITPNTADIYVVIKKENYIL